MSVPPRIAFSTLAFPDAALAAAAAAGRRQGGSGIEPRLIDGELIDPEGFTRASRFPEICPERTGYLLALNVPRPSGEAPRR